MGIFGSVARGEHKEESDVDIYIEGLGVFMLAARSKGEDLAKDISAKSVDSVRIFFQANKELKITKTATRADEKLDLISLDDYLKKVRMED